jgi:hypothetical protein
MPYAHNKLLRRLRAHARGTARAIDRYSFKNAIPALQNLDLSRKGAPTQHVKMLPLGPVHRPHSIRISGLREAAEALALNGNGRCELQLRYISFPEVVYDKSDKTWNFTNDGRHRQAPFVFTEWIPMQVVPEDGLLLHLAQPTDDDPTLVSVVIEWREVREVDGEVKTMPGKSVARIAAMQYSDALAAELAQEAAAKEEANRHLPAQPQAPDWQKDPQAFLTFALGVLAQNPETIPKTT